MPFYIFIFIHIVIGHRRSLFQNAIHLALQNKAMHQKATKKGHYSDFMLSLIQAANASSVISPLATSSIIKTHAPSSATSS